SHIKEGYERGASIIGGKNANNRGSKLLEIQDLPFPSSYELFVRRSEAIGKKGIRLVIKVLSNRGVRKPIGDTI
ncbi:883_t:CDS:2, partial [Gigaspora margarita]